MVVIKKKNLLAANNQKLTRAQRLHCWETEENLRTQANVMNSTVSQYTHIHVDLLMSCKKSTSLEKPPLSKPVLDVVESMGFELMTPVQVAAIPLLLSREDVSAESVTGSEKH
uniref:RNA helicase n=1 Tax=Glossina palpalis gambiensis TaxID=67801 RepID=A0A1B0BR68_9MUSC